LRVRDQHAGAARSGPPPAAAARVSRSITRSIERITIPTNGEAIHQ
jgi:hypothetical protein